MSYPANQYIIKKEKTEILESQKEKIEQFINKDDETNEEISEDVESIEGDEMEEIKDDNNFIRGYLNINNFQI